MKSNSLKNLIILVLIITILSQNFIITKKSSKNKSKNTRRNTSNSKKSSQIDTNKSTLGAVVPVTLINEKTAPISTGPTLLPPLKSTGDVEKDKIRAKSRKFCVETCQKNLSAPLKPCYQSSTKKVKACSPCKLGNPGTMSNEDKDIANNLCSELCLSVEPDYQCDFFGFSSSERKPVSNIYLDKFGLKIVRRFKK